MKITTAKEKAKAIWRKHKGKILFVMTAVGIVVVCRKIDQKRQDTEIVDKAIRDYEEAVKQELLKSEQAAKEEMESTKEEPVIDETKLTEGGSIAENNLYETDAPNCLCNEVPLTSMGAFGKDMIEMLKDEYPDYEKTGPFDPDTAVADVYVDFCHAKWLAAHKEEINQHG